MNPKYWRSLAALENSPEYREMVHRELPPAVAELELTPIGRRTFMGTMGATLALGGLTQLTGCIRKPQEKILPYARRPEDSIPGKPSYYATAAFIGGQVIGLLAESQDGRPTKIEGNPQHPSSLGATNVWAQASVLDLYSPDRSQKPVKAGGSGADWNWKAPLWKQVDDLFAGPIGAYREKHGKGLSLLLGETRSPTVRALLGKITALYPEARLYRHDTAHPANALAGAALAGVKDALPVASFDQADVIVSIDHDFLGCEGDTVRLSMQFANGRRITGPGDKMNRLYAVEPSFTVTGGKADHRLQLRGTEVGAFLAAVGAELFGAQHVSLAGAEGVIGRLAKGSQNGKWAAALAKDLAQHAGRSVIVVGERQPAWVHGLGNLLNAALGNVGKTVHYVPYAGPPAGSIQDLARAINNKEVETLVILGVNPAFDAPAELDFTALLSQVPTSVHHGMYRDETARLATWHVPASHYLEAWGDLESSDGTASIQQPLIAPLYDTLSEIEVLARMAGMASPSGHDIVRAQWESRIPVLDFEGSWRRWLHDGLIPDSAAKPAAPAFNWTELANAVGAAPAPGTGIELSFQVDPSVYDGRFAGNAWLQELPDPITKLVWDNAAFIGPSTAKRLGLDSGDMAEIAVGPRTLKIAVFVTPGVATDTVVLPLGYGRTAGAHAARGQGFNTHALRTTAGWHFASGAIQKSKGQYKLASTQDYGSLTPTTHQITGLLTAEDDQGFEKRNILRETTLEEYKKEPHFVEKAEVVEKDEINSLFTEPHPWKNPAIPKSELPQQWGMSIDLNACTGCNACVVACQAENNIGVVGKERILMGRELSWIRLDRYYSGSVDDPRISVQPLPCQQCENAPCETVCPVNATTHSPEGLNDMAYNRCIGTRYCSNNCPYKVRRFNYFNFAKENDAAMPLLAMQRNPDVTVRFRGVMEKCTYCVQRINQAKIAAKRDGDGRVPDKTIVPACGQACPSRAIVFGDVSDPKSDVSRMKEMDRDYTVLAELNAKPRTTYLAGLRNANPELG